MLLFLCVAVSFARLFFPAEARVAMNIANAETSEFAGPSASSGSNGNLREVDLNETPTMQKKRLLSRVESLMKTGTSFKSVHIQYFVHVVSIEYDVISLWPLLFCSCYSQSPVELVL